MILIGPRLPDQTIAAATGAYGARDIDVARRGDSRPSNFLCEAAASLDGRNTPHAALSAGDARFGSQECRQLEHHVGLLIKDETTDQVIAGESVEVHALQLRVGDCVISRGGNDPGKTPGRISEFIEKDGTRYAIVRWTDGRSPTEEHLLKIKKCWTPGL